MISALLGFTPRFPRLGFHFNVPQGWHELSQPQILEIMPLITKQQPKLLLEARLVMILLNVRWWNIFKLTYIWFLKPENKLLLHALTEWVYTDQPKFDENPFPELRIGKNTLHGPGRQLRHVRTMEFFLALRCLNKHRDTGNIKYLREMVAQLYRPAKADINRNSPEWDGDPRQPYSQHVSEELLQYLKLLPDAYFWALKIYVETALPVITRPYPAMFPQQADDKKGNPKKDATAEIIKSILFNLPGDTFGRLTDRANERLVNVLGYLEEERLKHEKQMEAIGKSQNKIKH